jgi:hypothetical protein
MPSKSGTLTANSATEVDVGDDAADTFKREQEVEVLNRDGAAEIWFTVDGSTPTVAGDNCYCLPAAIGALKVAVAVDGPAPVKLISSGTPKYCVTVNPKA